MAICATCGKEIKNIYMLEGKVYGYNCYKMELAKKYKKFIDEKNLKYSLVAMATIETYKKHKETTTWGADFKKSILKQFADCGKLTYKQLSCIVKRFDKFEKLNNDLLTSALYKDNGLDDEYKEICKDIKYYFTKSEFIEKYKYNDSFQQCIRDSRKAHMNIYAELDKEENKVFYYILTDKKLKEYISEAKEDDDIEVVEVITL